MAWIYLAESAESQKPWKATSDRSPTVKTTDTLKVSSYLEWHQETYLLLRSGTMFVHFDQPTSTSTPTSSMVASPARTLALQDAERAWKESEADYFSKSLGSLARYDRNSSSWKTHQRSLIGDYWELQDNLPSCGMTVAGEFHQLEDSEPLTGEEGGGCWRTPMASDGIAWAKVKKMDVQNCIAKCLRRGGTDRLIYRFLWHSLSILQATEFVEWMMGYPKEWTALDPWAMQWFRSKHGQRSKG